MKSSNGPENPDFVSKTDVLSQVTSNRKVQTQTHIELGHEKARMIGMLRKVERKSYMKIKEDRMSTCRTNIESPNLSAGIVSIDVNTITNALTTM